MEENNNYENRNVIPEKHCWKKCLGMLLAAFVGGFLAFYFVADQAMQRIHYRHAFKHHNLERMMLDDMDRMYRQDMKAFDDMFKKNKKLKAKHHDLGMPFFMMDNVKIKTEFDDNKFNIIVCLKPFNGDESKVNYNVEGRKLTLFGSSQVKGDDFEQDVAFSQDYILPKNADIANITKEKDGNKLIISVPIKE